MCHQRYRRGEKPYLVFNWKSQWDYLFTALEERYSYEERSAVTLFRDEIPLDWWTAHEDNGEMELV